MTGALRIADASREAPVPHGAGDDANEDVVAHDRGRRTGLITPIAASRAVRVTDRRRPGTGARGLPAPARGHVADPRRRRGQELPTRRSMWPAASRPDVVVVDANLPGGDSVAVAGRLRAESGAAVMLLTDSENDERTLAALRVGVSGLLLKDTEPGELVRWLPRRWRAATSPSHRRSVKRLIAPGSLARPEPGRPTDERLDELTRQRARGGGARGAGPEQQRDRQAPRRHPRDGQDPRQPGA